MNSSYRKAALMILLAAVLTAIGFAGAAAKDVDSPFLAKPYLNLGDNQTPGRSEKLTLLWHATDKDQDWQVEYQAGESMRKVKPKFMRVQPKGITPFRVYEATMDRLTPGAQFPYKVLLGGATAFESKAKARKAAEENVRAVIFGDCAQNTEGQRAIAFQTSKLDPDFVFITGDIVYSRGKVSEYREKYFPVYNAEEASIATGAPLIRSTLFIAAPGNHDIGNPVDISQDVLGYFYFWRQPMNGPNRSMNDSGTPKFRGDAADGKKFTSTVGSLFPRMSSFSFDYGIVHWTVLDTNGYVDWTDARLRDWLKKDLANAKNAKWRIVGFHHPPFNSSKSHFNDQRARVLTDIFEEYGVTVAMGGHVHNYQRTHPLKFKVAGGLKPLGKETKVPGEFEFDKEFDGKTKTKPNGVVYLVTGAGGAGLYNPDQTDNPKAWEPFTTVFKSNTHSLTLMEATAEALSFRQVSATGQTIDEFKITR